MECNPILVSKLRYLSSRGITGAELKKSGAQNSTKAKLGPVDEKIALSYFLKFLISCNKQHSADHSHDLLTLYSKLFGVHVFQEVTKTYISLLG